jgi:hypothetical protein
MMNAKRGLGGFEFCTRKERARRDSAMDRRPGVTVSQAIFAFEFCIQNFALDQMP